MEQTAHRPQTRLPQLDNAVIVAVQTKPKVDELR
jgi:hypothetical protein